MNTQVNLLSVDMEEWFVAEIFAKRISFEQWPEMPSTVVRNSRVLLDLFRRKNVTSTWFVLGWCAESNPALIEEILAGGHEIACHSYRHRRVDQMTPQAFAADLKKATAVIKQASGERPQGFRAPSWSINSTNLWAFDVLAEAGYEYDSSIFPIKHDIYGMPDGPTTLQRMSLGDNRFLYEIPASTFRLFGHNLPVSGGGYLRHSPYWFVRSMIHQINRKGRPANIYVHPWEIDDDPPQLEGLNAIERFRSRGSTNLLMMKLEKLLSDFEFTSCRNYLAGATQRSIGFH